MKPFSVIVVFALLASILFGISPASAAPVVRLYVFMSPDCNHCDAVHKENIDKIAASHGASAEIKYFDVDKTEDYKRLCDLESRYGATHDSMPVVFIGTDSLGGEKECSEKIESLITKYSSKGTTWPDEASPLSKPESPQTDGSGTISFEKTEADLGVLDAGTVIESKFTFKNTGDSVLSIKAIRTACGCFECSAKSMKLQPGESSDVQVAFDTESLEGPFSKSVMIDSTDPLHPTVRLTLKAQVTAVATIAPERWNYGTIAPGCSRKQALIITPSDPREFAVLSAKPDGTHVTVLGIKALSGMKKQFKVLLSVRSGKVTERVCEHVKFQLKTRKGQRALSFMVFGNTR